jgi:5-methylcytosine-specific restriction endonuclease McrA
MSHKFTKNCVDCNKLIAEEATRCLICANVVSAVIRRKLRTCEMCGCQFDGEPFQKYCGSSRKRIGCAWTRKQNTNRNSKQNTKLDVVRYQHSLQTNRMWKQLHKKEVDAYMKWWRENNTTSTRSYTNRRHSLLVQAGSHTNTEWKQLKAIHNYKCTICGINEDQLKIIWSGIHKGFTKLTKDHIVPISEGGSNYIINIQPACISCNSRKNNKIQVM